MGNSNGRWWLLAGGILAVFITTIAVLVNIIPKPHRSLDYLVIGAVATFLSMILLWVALMQQGARPKE